MFRFKLQKSVVGRVAVAALASSALPVSAATFDVTYPLWSRPSRLNSFAWAIDQSNQNPGADVIRLLTDVNVDNAPAPADDYTDLLAPITDPAGLEIQGNGYSLIGNPTYVTDSGQVVTKFFPSRNYNKNFGDILLAPGKSLFAVIPDNAAFITIDRLNVDGMNGFVSVGKNTPVTITDSKFINSVPFGFYGRTPILANNGSTINLSNVLIENINPFFDTTMPGQEYKWDGAIFAYNSTLNMINSKIDLSRSSSVKGGVNWHGGTANIVSSIIIGQGLSIIDNAKQGVLNFVNSIFRPIDHSATARIQAYFGGEANVTASTIQYDAFFTTDVPYPNHCPSSYLCKGAPLQAFADGVINLQSSAVSVLNTYIRKIFDPYSDYVTTITGERLPGVLTADEYSYVKPVPDWGAAELKDLFGQPALITAGDAYALAVKEYVGMTYKDLPEGAYPDYSGPLIGVVPDADGFNQLINPIDDSVISTDVFGNPRTYMGRRDIGAVQTQQVPGPLPLMGVGAALGWSRRLRRPGKQAAPRRPTPTSSA